MIPEQDPPKTWPVAVWLYCDADPPEDPAGAILALNHITDDSDKTLGLIRGTDETSVYPWKGVVAGPVSLEAGEVIVKWLASVGAKAVIDDGYYDDDGEGSHEPAGR